jgi:hypothetical protein
MVRRALLFTSLLLTFGAPIAIALGGRTGDAVAAEATASPLITVLEQPLAAADGTTDRACHASWRPGAPGVATAEVPVASGPGYLRVALGGADGDWDIAVFDSGGHAVVASAEPDSEESAHGWTAFGGVLRVQACRRSGEAESVPVTLQRGHVTGDADAIRRDPPRVARVYVPTQAQRDLLLSLGLDMTEHGGINTLGVILHGDADEAKLRHANLKYDILVEDLIAQSLRERRAEVAAASRDARSALPSGRTGTYRTLADYNAEMKKLADENPDLVKLFVMPNKTLLGKDVMGIEIAKDVNRKDGRPAFFNMGVHHAREWPAGEMPMEWAHELVNGFKNGNARATDVVTKSRNIVVPIVNPDGFEASRSAGSVGGADGGRNPAVDDLAYIVGGAAFGGEYRRKNCRLPDDTDAANCLTSPGAVAENGVDPNRNYGGLWGGPGAETTPNGLTYRGPGPFSEAETRNIQSVVSSYQVTSLITNHTTAGLILRAPGVAALGDPVDENRGYKALGDAMAKETGYFSQKGFELYDTTGTTEDWSYNATGGFGFTFEIYCGAPNYETGDCDAPSFHPTYEIGVDKEWTGENPQADHTNDPAGAYDGKGNREAYYIAAESAINAERHSVIEGTAPAGATLRLTKSFKTPSWPQPQEDDSDPKPVFTDDKLETTYVVGENGKYEWHVNPSTRPFVAISRPGPDGPPSPEVTFSGMAGPDPRPCPGYYPLVGPQIGVDATCWVDHGFEFPVGGGVDNDTATVLIEFLPSDDWDLEIYEDADGDGVSEPQDGEKLVGNSGNGATNAELGYEQYTIQAPDTTKKYVARIINYAATGSYDGKVTFQGPPPAQEAQVEAWTLTCEVDGEVLQTEQVVIDRAERKTVDLTQCQKAAPVPTPTVTPTVSPGPGPGPGPDGKCTATRAFRSVDVRSRGEGARLGFALREGVDRPVRIDVFKPATARKVLRTRKVQRFDDLSEAMDWDGRDKKGRKLGSGYYFVRYLVKTGKGVDIRRVPLQRKGGRFTELAPFDQRDKCGPLRQYKLSGPVFGGTTDKPLGIALRLGTKADVRVVVRRGGDVVKRFSRSGAPAGERLRFRLPAKGLKRGDYDVALSVEAGERTAGGELRSRKI